MLFGGVDQRLVQIHHQDQFSVPVEPLLVLSAQLLGLLLKRIKAKSTKHGTRVNAIEDSISRVSNVRFLQFQQGYRDSFPNSLFLMANLVGDCD